jgi:hypothetical protein
MAIEKNIVIGADLSGLEKKLDELIDALKASQKQADKTAEAVNDIADSTENIGESSKKSAKSMGALGSSVGAIGKNLKGFFLLQFALDAIKELFDNNQQVVDLFNTAFNTLQIAFSDFSKWIQSNIGGITGFFKNIFDNPKESLIAFGNAIKENLIERFNSFLDTLGFIASAVKKVFSGDFAGALEDVKNAGKETVDVFTGVDGSLDKMVDTTKKVATAVADYTTKTVKAASAMTELNKQAELADVLSQGLIEKYDLQAEKLRQVRDDERLSMDERIKANEELGEVLRKQEEEMLKLAEIRLAKASQDLALAEDNIEFQKAHIEATNELAAVQAQVAGFRSEQLMNEMSLQRELLDIERARGETEIELFEMQSEARRAAMFQEQARIKQEIMDIGTVAFLKKEALREELENTEENSTRYFEILDERKLVEQEYQNSLKDLKRQEENIERQVQDAKVQMVMDGIGAINGLVQAFAGENEEAQKRAFMINKVAGIANAVISTAAGITKALEQTTDPTPTQSFRFGNAALVAATGAAQIATIARQQFTPSGTLDDDIPNGGGGGSMPPQFNVVGSTGTNAILQSLQQNPVKAYVVGSDVTSQQELDRNRIKQSTF